MSYLGRLTCALALALTGSVAGAATAQALPDTSDNKIQVVQHNPDALGPGPAMQAAADWGGVDAITFQELCKSQVAELTAAGYRVHWREQRAATDASCRKGNAIASVHTFGDTSTRTLITRGTGKKKRVFKLLCVDLQGTGVARTTVCTSHFPLDYNGKNTAPSGEQNRVTVANKIRGILDTKIENRRRVVMTGDFNDGPKSAPLDRFYKVKGSGRFWEGDQKCGKTSVCRAMAPTTDSGRELDYFFASAPGVNKLSGVSKLPVPDYDPVGHFVVRGSVKFGALP
ncbi:endonuclease/exonuclease/phosphatase family protein [Nocardioides euryhalodurans]|uniref:Endonuclease/exonuclease/phosphatase family protein n=1 Tax=Nocardioides euryhalodurans TaxID=2518370 RepID=A0A4P7GL08_9ACTN|nr:endonuclease/exonuclease/phosphatase family protein [Nocardioides euryhalodurans]QBR92766.1 endonuclease/exonuclease/phosphatase family protein [Nocardioides euryhalodurans]